jgi:hypothetical protein
VVGHYEGISVAADLSAQGKEFISPFTTIPSAPGPVRNATACFAASAQDFSKSLRAAQSIDVTSWGMRNLYRWKYGVQCFALYLHIVALPQLSASPDARCLTRAHRHALSSATVSPRCLSLQETSLGTKTHPSHCSYRRLPEMDAIAAQDRGIFASHGDLSEENAIPLLAACDFLYAMYPAGENTNYSAAPACPLKFPLTCRRNGQSSPISPPTARSPAWSQNINLAPSAWLASKTISQVTFIPSSSTPYRGKILCEPQAT